MIARTISAALVFSLLGGLATAQVRMDAFDYKAGTTIPGYTEQRGDWKVTGTALESDGTYKHHELTHNQLSGRNCAIEFTVTHDPTAGALSGGGAMLRYTGSGDKAKRFIAIMTDGRYPYDGLDHWGTGYYDGSQYYSISGNSLSTVVRRARIRLMTEGIGGDVSVTTWIDLNMDGKWDIIAGSSKPLAKGVTGLAGVAAYGRAHIDDLRYYNATLNMSSGPIISRWTGVNGTATPGLPYVIGASLGNQGIPLPGGRRIPLTLDALLFGSLRWPDTFKNFLGVVKPNGQINAAIFIPYEPALRGLTVWCSALTYRNGAIYEITPDIQMTIQ